MRPEVVAQAAGWPGPATTVADVVDVFRRHLHLPDPGPLYAVLGTVAAHRLDGDPVWTVLVAPSGSGKTEIASALAGLDDVHLVGTLSGEAALLSGTARKERAANATGGLLPMIGEGGILCIKDFGSILSLQRDTRSQVLAALREIYDGKWLRDLGTDGGKRLTWQGKLGLVACCVPTLDQHYAVMATLGERFLLYRLAVTEAGDHARRSLDHIGSANTMREELRDAVTRLFDSLASAPLPKGFSQADKDRLVALSTLVVKARSPVVRESYSARTIELVPDAEAPGRLIVELGQLLLGLRTLGLDHATAWELVAKVGLDSMPALRRRALEVCVSADDQLTTAEVVTSLGVPATTTRRTLEDLVAHGVLVQHGSGQGTTVAWSATSWARTNYAAATSPEMSEPLITPNPPMTDNSGEVTAVDF